MQCPRCGWQNLPDTPACLQCGADLGQDVPVYPERADQPSGRTALQAGRWRRPAERRSAPAGPGYLRRAWDTAAATTRTAVPYLRIMGLSLPALLPGLVQLIQRRWNVGALFTGLAVILGSGIALFLQDRFCAALEFLAACLMMASAYDAVVHYYRSHQLALNVPLRLAIVLNSISGFYIMRVLAFLVLNHFFIRIVVPNDTMSPAFRQGDEVLAPRGAGQRFEPQRGDVVIFRYGNTQNMERIIGLPGEHVMLKNGRYYVNGQPVGEGHGPLNPRQIERVQSDSAAVQLGASQYFTSVLQIYYQSPVRLLPVSRQDIIGRPAVIIYPPQRRGMLP